MSKLYLGAAKTDITPKIGCQLYGYRDDIFSDSIHDGLSATAYVFKQNDVLSALISVTVCLIKTELIVEIKKIIESEFGIPYNNIIIVSTHTHSGPNTRGNTGWGDIDAEYCNEIFIPGIIEAVKNAADNMQEVTVGYAIDDSLIGVNRRELWADNTIHLGQCNSGPFNPQMTVICFKDKNEKLVACLVHYGCHCTAAGSNTEITQDWAGVMVRRLETLTGAVCAFFNGPEGDVGPRLTNGKTGGDITYVEEHGGFAAFEAVRVFKKVNNYKECDLKSFTNNLNLSLKPREDYQHAKEQCERFKNAKIGCNVQTKDYYERIVNSYENGYTDKEFLEIEQTVIRIGNIVFVSFPYELFSEIGLKIQKETKDYIVLSLSNANGSEGYFPTEIELSRGGYEVAMFYTANVQQFKPNADYNLISETLKNIKNVI